MPQLNLLRSSRGCSLTLDVWMPPPPMERWTVTWCAMDGSGRTDSNGALTVAAAAEKADLGFVLKAAYDHWFNADAATLGSLIEREIRLI